MSQLMGEPTSPLSRFLLLVGVAAGTLLLGPYLWGLIVPSRSPPPPSPTTRDHFSINPDRLHRSAPAGNGESDDVLYGNE